MHLIIACLLIVRDEHSQRLIDIAAKEGDSGYRHHGINKEIGKHLNQSCQGIGNENLEKYARFRKAERRADVFVFFVHFGKAIPCKNVGGAIKVDDIDDNKDSERTIKEAVSPFEEGDVPDAEDDAWDGDGRKRRKMNGTTDFPGHTRGEISREIGEYGAE